MKLFNLPDVRSKSPSLFTKVFAYFRELNNLTQRGFLKNTIYVLGIFAFLAFLFLLSLGIMGSQVLPNLNLCGRVPVQGCRNFLSTLTYAFAIVAVQVFLKICLLLFSKKGAMEVIPGIWRSRRDHGFLFLGFGITIFAFFLAIGMEANLPTPWTNLIWIDYSSKLLSDVSIPLFAWSTIFAAAFWEELLFRGYSMQFMINNQQEWIGGSIASFLFAIFHRPNSVQDLIYFVIFGFTLFLCYKVTRSIWFSVGIHFGWNLMLELHSHGGLFWRTELVYPYGWVRLLGEGIKLPFVVIIPIIWTVLLITKIKLAKNQRQGF